jgi:hypothetical protein
MIPPSCENRYATAKCPGRKRKTDEQVALVAFLVEKRDVRTEMRRQVQHLAEGYENPIGCGRTSRCS